MGLLETLGHLKNPHSSPYGPVHRALQGLPIVQYCPCQSVCTVHWIIPLLIYALSYNNYNYVYVLAEYSIKEEDICYSFNIILRVKRICFYKANQFQRKKQTKLKLFENLF